MKMAPSSGTSSMALAAIRPFSSRSSVRLTTVGLERHRPHREGTTMHASQQALGLKGNEILADRLRRGSELGSCPGHLDATAGANCVEKLLTTLSR